MKLLAAANVGTRISANYMCKSVDVLLWSISAK